MRGNIFDHLVSIQTVIPFLSEVDIQLIYEIIKTQSAMNIKDT